MDERNNITMTFKNDFQSLYEANYAYARIKGRLSRSFYLKIMIPAVIFSFVASVMIFIEDGFSFENDIGFLVVLILITAAVMVISFFLIKAAGKSQIRNYCKVSYDYGFESKSPVRAEFDENGITLNSGYSKITAPYGEIDFLISDRLNFVFIIGSDLRVRNIPKINQNPDALFSLDNLLREKLGERFIYKM